MTEPSEAYTDEIADAQANMILEFLKDKGVVDSTSLAKLEAVERTVLLSDLKKEVEENDEFPMPFDDFVGVTVGGTSSKQVRTMIKILERAEVSSATKAANAAASTPKKAPPTSGAAAPPKATVRDQATEDEKAVTQGKATEEQYHRYLSKIGGVKGTGLKITRGGFSEVVKASKSGKVPDWGAIADDYGKVELQRITHRFVQLAASVVASHVSSNSKETQMIERKKRATAFSSILNNEDLAMGMVFDLLGAILATGEGAGNKGQNKSIKQAMEKTFCGTIRTMQASNGEAGKLAFDPEYIFPYYYDHFFTARGINAHDELPGNEGVGTKKAHITVAAWILKLYREHYSKVGSVMQRLGLVAGDEELPLCVVIFGGKTWSPELQSLMSTFGYDDWTELMACKYRIACCFMFTSKFTANVKDIKNKAAELEGLIKEYAADDSKIPNFAQVAGKFTLPARSPR